MKVIEFVKKNLLLVLIAVVALTFLCLLLPCGAMKYDGSVVHGTKTWGFGIIFGKNGVENGITYHYYDFSGRAFVSLLFFLIFAAGSIVLTFLKGLPKVGKYAILASGLTLCIAAFCFLAIKGQVKPADAALFGYYKPRIGCYLGGIISFFSGLGVMLFALLTDSSFGLDNENKETAPVEEPASEEAPVEEAVVEEEPSPVEETPATEETPAE